jgi:hypothetical protein
MKKKTNKNNIVIVATVAIVAIAGVSVYAISNNDDGMMGNNNMMNENSSQQASSSSLVDKNSADYKMYSELTGDDYDRMFIANMIEHHKGAVDMAKLAQTNAKHQELKDMAEDIISAQSKEITDMESWQTAWSYPSNDYENEFHENERIEACDDSHRTHSLENQALFYQWFQVDNIDKDEVKRRQDTIWAIWDNYYSQLPPKAKESNSDKTWRLYLSRMDSRKMKLTTEKKNGQTLIGFSPKIDPKLKAFSNAALKESQDAMKHSNLMIWATAKWRGDENLTYIIPRFNDIIIGGTAQSNDWNLKVDPDDTADILRKAGVIANEFTDVKVLEEKVGLRPARDEIRLEAEDKNGKTLIHNYGHGGAGFTLSWGCAYNVVKLVKEQK